MQHERINWNGVLCEYTGKQILRCGRIWYEIRILEGPRSGVITSITRPPVSEDVTVKFIREVEDVQRIREELRKSVWWEKDEDTSLLKTEQKQGRQWKELENDPIKHFSKSDQDFLQSIGIRQ